MTSAMYCSTGTAKEGSTSRIKPGYGQRQIRALKSAGICRARSTYRRAWRCEHPNRPASSRAASATGTPASTSSAAALTRAAYSPPPARRPPPMP